MANQQIDNIEDINEAINPITPPINGQEGLEMLGHNRNQSVILSRFSRSFFKIYSHLISLYLSVKNLGQNKLDKGNYTQTAENLKNDIDTKASKSGDTFTGYVGFNKGFRSTAKILVEIGLADKEFPNGINDNNNNFLTDFIAKYTCHNNALTIFGQNAFNARRMALQSSHSSTSYAEVPGILELNPYGGDVRINGAKAYCENYKPTKSDIGLPDVDNTPDINKSVRSASRLTTSRSITIGNKSYTFDGSNNISYSLADIGAVNRNGDSIDGKLFIDRKTTGSMAGISLALGDNDTGFNWEGDGELYAYANNVKLWNLKDVYNINNKPTKADVGLGNVDNTSDSNKNVLTATRLSSGRSFRVGDTTKTFDLSNGISFTKDEIGTRRVRTDGCTGLNTTSKLWNSKAYNTFTLDACNQTLAMWVEDSNNSYKAYIQQGHNSESFPTAVGTLSLNPFGGAVLVNESPVITKNRLNQHVRFWSGSSYTADFTLPDGMTWNDILYIGCLGGNDSSVIDGYFIAGIGINGSVRCGYVQGQSTDMQLTFTKLSDTSGRFSQSGSGSGTSGPDQTFPITDVFGRRI
ncbi:hypothetical protein [uncultured Clostridium sp.]|uniref:hypothetical protein n=1 Tax=uncultured Clostridium sp. TaxID=59620 RepID=UPI00262CDFF3|nr:hypothetical protein [uncultured Clostridium sp.]